MNFSMNMRSSPNEDFASDLERAKPSATSLADPERALELAGTGLGFNNNYAPVTLGSDGSAYVGALGGLVRLWDD